MRDNLDIEYQAEKKDELTIEMILNEVRKNGLFKDNDFEDRVKFGVGRLHDEGVQFEKFLGSSRRIVFKGKYFGKDVVIKFSHAMGTLDHDEWQQQNEEYIWNKSVTSGDRDYFARILIADINKGYVVQEYCTNVRKYEDDDLPESHRLIAEKYGICENELGFKNGLLKFVDYGH